MNFLIRLVITALSLVAVAYIVPGIQVDSFYIAIISAFILGLLNAVVRPVLIVLTLPITILTLGIFIFVINAGIFLFVARFIDGFTVDSFWYALLGSVLVGLASGVANNLAKD